MFVRSEQPYAIQAAFPETYKEATPAFLAFACPLACAEYFPVAVFGYPYRDEHRDACHFATPAALQVDPVNEDIGIFPGERTVAPLFYFSIHLLVQAADGRGADTRTPQELSDVFHAAHGYPGQVHLDKRLLD